MILLLDTTVLIDLLRGRKDRRELVAELVEGGLTLATAAINVGEVYAGMRRGEEARTEALLTNLVIVPMTVEIARLAGKLKCEWARKGQTYSLPDMIVAATGMEHRAVLMTDNRKDFRMISGLELYPLS
jgi:predicted nucleic acid-binding protein